jgi:hypothetical protein
MNTWDIVPAEDGAVGIAAAAREALALVSRFRAALNGLDRVQPIWELSEMLPSAGRSVIQVRVTPAFFADFFNSSSGYRGMFRRGPRVGSATNAALVDAVQSMLSTVLSETVDAHLVAGGMSRFEWIGRKEIPRSTFLRSLDPSLAKVWYSTTEVCASGEIRQLPSGIEGGIDVGLLHEWAEIRQDKENCVIEVKGAFVGSCGLFQTKDPEERARELSAKGQA